MIRYLIKKYYNLLNRFPMVIMSSQACVTMAAGDLVSQTLVENRSIRTIDWKRSIRFGMIGLIFTGPPLSFWYAHLDKTVRKDFPYAALKKMAMDQLFFAPPFIAYLTVVISYTNGNTVDEIKQALKRDYWDILLTNYWVWPAIQVCNFTIFPLQHQVLVAQTAALFWNTYLSWKLHKIDGPERVQ